MIAFVHGLVCEFEEDYLIIDMDGLGLTVQAPLSRLRPYPEIGQKITLHTHMVIREDAWNLYGFDNKDDLRIFRMLLNVSGIGAKTALAIVDKLNPQAFAMAVVEQNISAFTAVSGIGKKSAERIILELKDKFANFIVPESEDGNSSLEIFASELNADLLAALKQLGYSATEARAYARKAQDELGPEATEEELLRKALKISMKS